MSQLVSYAQQRRQIAVGLNGVVLGLDQAAGVVLANVLAHDPETSAWMPTGQAFVEVWTVGDPTKVWAKLRETMSLPGHPADGVSVVMLVRRPNRWPWSWARWRAWWRWQVRAR